MYYFIRRKDIPYIILTAVLGSVAHFLYEFSEQNPFTALIAPVNESTWEHLKLLFFPYLLMTAIEFYFRRPKKAAFFAARYIGVCFGMLSIIFLFYGYTAILGKHLLLIDILIFLFGVVFAYFIAARLYRPLMGIDSMAVFFAWFITILLFFIFTCYPPDFTLFYPPE